tara:strand:- start:229 stop:432 length:204 start_codon:yes stop_codon:yes gene_type:complete
MNDYIKKEDLKVGLAYNLHSRNINPGIWDGKEFHGVRSKFGQTFMDTEYHWDDGAPHGTAKPTKLLG